MDSVVPQALIDITSWLCRRAYQVFTQFSQHTPPTPDPSSAPPSGGYLVTGVCYGSPAVWVRPKYIHIPDDSALEDKLQNLAEHTADNSACGLPPTDRRSRASEDGSAAEGAIM